MDAKVEVRGLRELASAFRQLDAEMAKGLKTRFLALAENVAGSARSKVPRRTGNAAASIKARASTRGAALAFGGTAAEYFPWLNFGGRVGRHKSIVRARVEPDRYIYATIIEKRADIIAATDRVIEDAAKAADFETHG